MNRLATIYLLCAILLLLLLLLCLGGCASSQQTTQVLWHDGKCLFFVDGISAQQAGEMTKEWEFEPCEIHVDSELGASEENTGDTAPVETP